MDHVAISKIVEQLARSTGLTQEQIEGVLQAQACLAYEMAGQGYPLPGIGVLALTQRPARKMVMRFGPKQGQEVTLPSNKMLKFRVAKIAKEIVLLAKTPPDNLLEVELVEEERPVED
jgi:DNA-binding protein HU-beta